MLCRLLQHDDHERAHEEGTVCLLVELAGRVVEEFDISISLVSKKTAQFTNVLVRMREVGRTEVLIERLVYEFLQDHSESLSVTYTIDVEEKRLGVRLRWFVCTEPI